MHLPTSLPMGDAPFQCSDWTECGTVRLTWYLFWITTRSRWDFILEHCQYFSCILFIFSNCNYWKCKCDRFYWLARSCSIQDGSQCRHACLVSTLDSWAAGAAFLSCTQIQEQDIYVDFFSNPGPLGATWSQLVPPACDGLLRVPASI